MAGNFSSNRSQLANNYGRSDMTFINQAGVSNNAFPSSDGVADLNNTNGANVTPQQAATQSWWTTARNWTTAAPPAEVNFKTPGTAWNFSNIWEWDRAANLPKLRGLPNAAPAAAAAPAAPAASTALAGTYAYIAGNDMTYITFSGTNAFDFGQKRGTAAAQSLRTGTFTRNGNRLTLTGITFAFDVTEGIIDRDGNFWIKTAAGTGNGALSGAYTLISGSTLTGAVITFTGNRFAAALNNSPRGSGTYTVSGGTASLSDNWGNFQIDPNAALKDGDGDFWVRQRQ